MECPKELVPKPSKLLWDTLAALKPLRNRKPLGSMASRVADLEKRLWKRVVENNGCFNLMASQSGKGYAIVGIGPKTFSGHRLFWMLYKGSIPKGLLVCHKCDNRSCCNPEHLFLGTYQDNVDDCVKKDRNAKGESATFAKLKEAQVIEILKIKHTYGKRWNNRRFGEKFGVHRDTIGCIFRKRSWVRVSSAFFDALAALDKVSP